MKKHDEISELIAHHINGTINSKQKIELDKWLNQSEQNKQMFDKVLATDYNKRTNARPNWDDLQRRIRHNKPVHSSHTISSWKLQLINTAAACAAILAVYWYINQTVDKLPTASQPIVAQSSPIIGKGAILKTQGQTFDLQKKSVNIEVQGMKAKAASGKLKINSSEIKPNIKPVISQLKVPRGGVFHMELPDGTLAWLNSETELEFPSYFINGKRLVKVTGEAYFEVKSDKSNPFFVQTPKALVKVTGTRFNVSAYNSDSHTSVALAEGHVDVELANNWHTLAPGKQIQYDNTNGHIHTQKVDITAYLSWIKGIFEFEDMPIVDLATKLTRWYDVEFVFKNEKVKQERFTGAVKKDVPIAYLLDMITETTQMSYTQKNKTIIIE